MFCCVFGRRLFFTNLLFFAIFFFFSARFSCLLCLLVSVILLADFLTGRPLLWGFPCSFPDPLGILSFSPAARVRTHVRPDVVGSAGCSRCGLPVAPWDWQGLGQTVQELQRLGPPESLC